jgi:hypothetical protein
MAFRIGREAAEHQFPDKPNTGPTGPTGPAGSGSPGPTGPTGPTGAGAGAGNYASFYSIITTDVTLAVGSNMIFSVDGPASAGTTITRLSPGTFNLAVAGTYEVTWQASINEAGQLQIALNGTPVADTVVGRDALTNQIVGNTLITTVTPNTILAIVNPFTNVGLLTETGSAGGDNPVTVTLTIKQLA